MAVDPDGADGAALGLGAAGRVRVEHGALAVGAEHVFDVLEGEQAPGATASRQVIGFWACPDVPVWWELWIFCHLHDGVAVVCVSFAQMTTRSPDLNPGFSLLWAREPGILSPSVQGRFTVFELAP